MFSGSMFAVSAFFATTWVVLMRKQKNTRPLEEEESKE